MYGGFSLIKSSEHETVMATIPAANTGNPISGGIDYGFYPTPRTYSFGFNVNF